MNSNVQILVDALNKCLYEKDRLKLCSREVLEKEIGIISGIACDALTKFKLATKRVLYFKVDLPKDIMKDCTHEFLLELAIAHLEVQSPEISKFDGEFSIKEFCVDGVFVQFVYTKL